MSRENKILSEFNFLLFSLKDKTHESSHQIRDSFFEQFENSLIEKGEFDVKIVLVKSETLLQFDFEINGKAQLTCDRSLEDFDYPLNLNNKLVFKFGEKFEEVSDQLIIIEHGTSELNISSCLYELIAIAIPFKKLHPKFQTEEDEFDDDEEDGLELVYSDDEYEDSEELEKEEEPNEMWADLKKKFNKE